MVKMVTAKILLLGFVVVAVLLSGCLNAKLINNGVDTGSKAVGESETDSEGESIESVDACSFPEELHDVRATTPL